MKELKQIPELTPHESYLTTLNPITDTKVSFDIENISNKKVSQLIRILQAGKKIKGWCLLVLQINENVVHLEAIKRNELEYEPFKYVS